MFPVEDRDMRPRVGVLVQSTDAFIMEHPQQIVLRHFGPISRPFRCLVGQVPEEILLMVCALRFAQVRPRTCMLVARALFMLRLIGPHRDGS